MKILVIEDEQKLLNSIVKGLQLSGYAVTGCDNGIEGERLISDNNYDLVLLDVNLPGMDGFTVLQRVREYNKELNIIMLTAKSDIESKVCGLDYGANDYITKPFHFDELTARIRSHLRRKVVQQDTVLSVGTLTFDTRSLEVSSNGKSIVLTSKETSILHYLLLKLDCVVSQQELLEHVWDNSVDEFSNSVRVHISSLRRKLRDATGVDPIINVIGKGYMIKGDTL